MNPLIPEISVLAIFLITFSGLLLFIRYASVPGRFVPLAWLGAVLLSLGAAYYQLRQPQLHFPGMHSGRNMGVFSNREAHIAAMFAGLFVMFLTAFCTRHYQKWLGGQLTDEERAPGPSGIRAWLSPMNLVVVICMAIFAWNGLHWSPFIVIVFGVGVLLAWPLLNGRLSAESPAAPAAAAPMTNASEREKVLALLEAGKITADESAELLHALGSSSTPVPNTAKPLMPRSRRLVLAGAVLVLIGFFLPWFRFSPAEAMSATLAELGAPFSNLEQMAAPLKLTGIVSARGGDIANGLGWLVLILGLAGAVLPMVAPQADLGTQRIARWLMIGGGGIILVYLISQDFRSASIGLALVLIGYAVQAIGLYREDHPAAGAMRGAVVDA